MWRPFVMEKYNEKLAKAELYEKLAEAEIQLSNKEELLNAETVFEMLRDKCDGK